MWYQFIITLIVGLLNILIGLFILRKNYKNPSNIFYACLCFGTGLWSLDMSLLAYSQRTMGIFGELSYIFGILPPLFYLLFAYHYPYKLQVYPKFLMPLIYLAPLLMIFLAVLGIMDFQTFTYTNGAYVDNVNWPDAYIFSFYFFVYVLWALIVLIRKFKKVEGIYALNIKYLIMVTLANFVMAGTVSVFLPLLGDVTYDWLGPIFTLINIIFIGHLLFYKNR